MKARTKDGVVHALMFVPDIGNVLLCHTTVYDGGLVDFGMPVPPGRLVEETETVTCLECLGRAS